MDPFLGQIIMFAVDFAPRGWALCDGQLLAIDSNSALFSILSTRYGGDGLSTFALPDLRGRIPMHPGHGPGLGSRHLGDKGGAESVSLTVAQMPAHGHKIQCSKEQGDQLAPAGTVLAAGKSSMPERYTKKGSGHTMKAESIVNTGGSQNHSNVQPFQCVNFIIALEGSFPSRS